MTYKQCKADVVFDAVEEWLTNMCISLDDGKDSCACPSHEQVAEVVDDILLALHKWEKDNDNVPLVD